MRAPDKVWTNISRQLHRRRRRMVATLSVFLLAASTAGYLYLANPVQQHSPVATQQQKKTFINQPSTTFNKPSHANTTSIARNYFNVTKQRTPVTAIESQLQGLLVGAPLDFPPLEIPERKDISVTEQQIEVVENNSEIPKESVAINNDDNPITNSLEQLPVAPDVASNPIKGFKSGNKLQWFLSFTPTISYRKLGENKSYMREVSYFSAPTNIAPLYSVNSAVTHKPNMGFELGVTSKYEVAKGVKLTGGLQFNVNRYDIKAFNAPYAIATIRLNSASGPDSVRMLSTYSNTNGYKTNWLENMYFQVSTPIGLELRLRGDEKMAFGISSSVQPTYVLGDRAYLITADYKNYAQVPWLMRRWNVNTNLQTFVSYSTGRAQWQVGPQVRYQLLSSFVTKYPVKENLFDFGLKVGVSLNK